MSLLIVIIFTLTLYFLVRPLSKGTSSSNGYNRGSGKRINHGHRCFTEGLDWAEKEVVRNLSHGLSHADYFIFNNLIIPSDQSVSTQIDHIIVSRYGVFVIETKECNGWIYAHKNRAQWTTTYKKGNKFPLPSPLWQNFGHIQALKKAMPFVEDNFFNLIVFVGDCEFKTQRIEEVLYSHELVKKITSYHKPVISEQRLLMTIGKLSYMCQAIDITPQEHVENIKNVLSAKTNNLQPTEVVRV